MQPLKIMIGYDSVESVAYHTLVQSIINHSTVPVAITPVKMSMLPEYHRKRDPRQSNEFSFTRFLTPYLANFEGWALFIDCDMMFRCDPAELFMLSDDRYSVMVVKHDYTPRSATKYLGAIQHRYPRKNWSSVMLFNCSHPDCGNLTPAVVNTEDPAFLHQMLWTSDEAIGELPSEWNHLVGDYDPNPDAKLAHFSTGGPYFNEYRTVEHSNEWFSVNSDMARCDQIDPRKVSNA